MSADIDPTVPKGNEFLARPAMTARLARGATRCLNDLGAGAVPEFILASGRRATLHASRRKAAIAPEFALAASRRLAEDRLP